MAPGGGPAHWRNPRIARARGPVVGSVAMTATDPAVPATGPAVPAKDAATHRAVEAVWRIEAPRLIAGLARLVRDVGQAEELAQDALVIALEQWPRDGVPDNPGSWLMATAKHRAVDLLRRQSRYQEKISELGRDLQVRAAEGEPDPDALDDHIGDDLLRLIFT